MIHNTSTFHFFLVKLLIFKLFIIHNTISCTIRNPSGFLRKFPPFRCLNLKQLAKLWSQHFAYSYLYIYLLIYTFVQMWIERGGGVIIVNTNVI